MQRNVTIAILTTVLALPVVAQVPPADLPPSAAIPPAVELPQVNAATNAAAAPVPAADPAAMPMGQLPSLTNAPAISIPAVPTPKIVVGDANGFSFGDAMHSILFTPEQVTSMKEALTTYETIRRTNTAPADIEIDEEEAVAEPVLVDPPQYPVITLSSIAFRNTSDWTVWITGQRITPKTNDGEVRVVQIGPNQVQFAWKPTFSDIMRQRYDLKMFAPTDSVKHKLTQPNNATFDEANNQVFFTLKTNQSFSAGHMATFEGKVPAPTMPPLPTVDGVVPAASTAATPQGTEPEALQKTGIGQDAIRQMYDNQSKNNTNLNPQAEIDALIKSREGIQAVVPEQTQQRQNVPATPTPVPAPAPTGALPALPAGQ